MTTKSRLGATPITVTVNQRVGWWHWCRVCRLRFISRDEHHSAICGNRCRYAHERRGQKLARRRKPIPIELEVEKLVGWRKVCENCGIEFTTRVEPRSTCSARCWKARDRARKRTERTGAP